MEPAEDNSLEDAIRWLVGTILGVLLMDKLDVWVRGVKLDDDVAKLKFEVERAESLIDDVRGKAHGIKSLARSLARLKELLYDADDMVDELDYYRLQQQVEGVRSDEPEGMHVAEPVDGVTRDLAEGMHGAERVNEMLTDHTDTPTRNRRVGKLRSKTWDHFTVQYIGKRPSTANCKYCGEQFNCDTKKNGLSTMTSHIKNICKKKPAGALPPIPSSNGDTSGSATAATEVATSSSSRKRKRAYKEPAQTTAAITQTPWDKAELSNRIKTITSQLQGILEALSKLLERHGPGCASSSDHHQSTILDQNRRTSSLVPGKVYGRDAEKDFIIKMITEDQSDVVTVLPIVGIAGVGKTALAQLVYNDPKVKSQFHHRIWVWVSRNFDEVRITREILDFVSPKTNVGSSHRYERHEGISSFAKLQEILKEHMEYREHKDDPLKKYLLILDDVWDNLDDHLWNKLLAPLIPSQMKGNVTLVTTRNLSVAKRLGTLQPVKLSALADDDFWLLFKSHAFGSKNYEGNQSLCIIGRQIVEKLNGNPLAAETAGGLLRKDLTIDHWSNILKDEHWKSLKLSRGIMPSLNLSYDQLPFHLQQCFSYTSIFPSSYEFLSTELVRIWISQGFVRRDHSSKRLEEIGQYYLAELVHLGFFQQVEVSANPLYAISGVMHDFARIVSRTDCAVIDGQQRNEILPTVHHFSILTGSAYIEDSYGGFPRNEKFEENLRNAVTSVSKLRTLVLLGNYDSVFLQMFQDILRNAHNLRLLQISAPDKSFLCSLANPLHIRYLKHGPIWNHNSLPFVLTNFFHLQVLDIASDTNLVVLDGMQSFVSMRHLVVEKGVCSKIANIGSMTSLQELEFKFQLSSSGFEMTQLQSMNELVELGMYQLEDVESREEAYGAGLRDKVYLRKLHLSWKDTLSDEEYSSNQWMIPDEEYASTESEELLPMDDGGQSSEPSIDTAREVLEDLEPHMHLKHLHISGYSGTTSPTWLASKISVTSLQTLHLEDCGEWQMLPSLEMLPLLTKLKLISMPGVTEALVPSLEELVLIKMPKLVRCSSTSVEGLSSSLRVLQIYKCHALEVFDLFEKDDRSEIRQRSWLPGLRKLILHDCPLLKVLSPLPPSTTCSKLLIRKVSTLPSMKRASSEKLYIGNLDDNDDDYRGYWVDKYSDELKVLDKEHLAFHNLGSLKFMRIDGCKNLSSFSFKGFNQLVSLKSLELRRCKELLSSDATHEDVTAENWKAFPSLESLRIKSCGIAGKWLSLFLQHAPHLEELHLADILTGEEGSLSGEEDGALTGLAQYELVHIPLNLISSLKKINVYDCPRLTFNCGLEGFSGFTSFRELRIRRDVPFLPLVHKDGNVDWANGRCLFPTSLEEVEIISSYSEETLQPCFPSDLTNLRKFKVWGCLTLESLQLRSCMALEELTIGCCDMLTALEGLQSLSSLRHLEVYSCPRLVHKDGTVEQENGKWLLPKSLRELDMDRCYKEELSQETLQPCFPGNLTTLNKLKLLENPGLKALQLHWCTALEELIIQGCGSLTAVEGLQSLSSLRHLKVSDCPRLVHRDVTVEQENGRWLLPKSLRELDINSCYQEELNQERLQPCFPGNLTSLIKLKLLSSNGLKSLQLHSCTALEELTIGFCGSLTELQGLQSLGSLRHLTVSSCPGLPPFFERFSRQGYELCSPLESLKINDPSVLTKSFCNYLTSLQRLILQELVLTEEQGRALVLLTSLQELEFYYCHDLVDIPAGLHTLLSLKRFKICSCRGISRLLETDLPLSLEELEIEFCRKELADQYRLLATSKLNVKIKYCS